MHVAQAAPESHRLRRDQALGRQHRFMSGAIDGDDNNRVADQLELRELTAELEPGGSGVREAWFDRGYVGTCYTVIRGIRHAIDTNLHALDTCRIKCPPTDS